MKNKKNEKTAIGFYKKLLEGDEKLKDIKNPVENGKPVLKPCNKENKDKLIYKINTFVTEKEYSFIKRIVNSIKQLARCVNKIK